MKYNKEFKAEALKLSDEIGVKKAAQQLGLPRCLSPQAGCGRRLRNIIQFIEKPSKDV